MTKNSMTKSRSRSTSLAQAIVDAKISTGGLVAVGTISTVVGLWSVACFVGAGVVSGGPFELAKAWISALTGG